MNEANVRKAIAVMERVKDYKLLDMAVFQSLNSDSDGYQVTEEDLHRCGNRACFAGWIAVSAEFRADGGKMGMGGGPSFQGVYDQTAIAAWLGISIQLAWAFVYGDLYDEDDEDCGKFYSVPFSEVKPQHVIEKLQQVLKGELT